MQVTHVWNRFEIPETRASYPLDRYPWLLSPFVTGNQLVWSRSEGLPPGSENDIRLLEDSGMQSFAGIPVEVSGEVSSCLGFSNTTSERSWDSQVIERFPVIAAMFSNLIARQQADNSLQKAFDEISELKSRLEKENIYLREEIELGHQHEEIIGQSKPVIEMLGQIEQVAATDATVLILGETGTGKELLANEIHRLNRRNDRPMIKVNCAALPATLIESELFGREKGAYTGAMSQQIGRFEIADGSTLFLDEIGEMPLEVQAKLLRVLQEGQFERLGSHKTVSVDVRIIASTNRDLAKAVREGKFREDLYYRLNVFSITAPPLRDRTEDIPRLVWAFVQDLEGSMGKTIEKIPPKSLDALQKYTWPGNIRELKNLVENAMIISKNKLLKIHPPADSTVTVKKILKLEDVERNHIKDVLKKTSWRIRGKNGASELLGIKPTTLDSRMKKLGIIRPQ
jgi:transcriptional regulator with GAF, ATPase, and Fis domain